MNQKTITELFLGYIDAFNHFDLKQLQACYFLPCTLHTPDKVSMLMSIDDFNQEFLEIFTVLKQANTEQLIATKASFTAINAQLSAVCIDWAFIDNKAEVFADFTAFYHVLKVDKMLKIINVVSHDLDNAVNLTELLPDLVKY